jgi:hypothetical protein
MTDNIEDWVFRALPKHGICNELIHASPTDFFCLIKKSQQKNQGGISLFYPLRLCQRMPRWEPLLIFIGVS